MAPRYLTEQQLDEKINVTLINVYGNFTKRGEHRNDILEESFEGEVIVPEKFNMGHVKLACNNFVVKKLQGIRVREFFVDSSKPPKPLEKKMRVRDFMSERGLRDNRRLKKEYDKEMAERRAARQKDGVDEINDTSEYDEDGLPKVSDRLYVM